MDLISWSDFVNLKDTTPIDDAVKKIDGLQGSFKTAVDSITKDSARLGGEYAILVTEAKAMTDAINALNTAQKQNQDTVVKAAKGAEDLAGATKANTDAQAAAATALNNVTAASKAASAAKDALLKGQSVELNSLDALKAKLDLATKSYAAMGDATDQSIKDDQLKKIDQLSNEYINAKSAIDAAKKSTDAAAGSYTELAAQVANSKQKLKDMGDGMEGNSVEFKALQKSVADGTQKLKDFDEKIGDNQRSVGDYKKALSGLSPEFSELIGKVEETGEALEVLVASPVGLVILAIAAALGTLFAYFERTRTGGDKLAEMLGELKAIFSFLLDQVAAFGGVLFDALSKPEALFKAVSDAAIELKDAIVHTFEDPLPAIKAFGQFIVDNLMNRITGFINVFISLGKALKALFTGNFTAFEAYAKDLANSAIQSVTGVQDVIGKVGGLISKEFIDKLAAAKELGKEIAELNTKLEEQNVDLIKKTADVQLAIDKDLLASKNKIALSDEARYAALQDAAAQSQSLLDDQIAAGETQLEIANKQIALKLLSVKLDAVPLDLIKEQVTAQANLTNLQDKAINDRIVFQKQEIGIIQEIEARQIAAAKAIFDAQTNLAKAQNDIAIAQQQRIQDDARSEVDVKNNAAKKIADAEIANAQISYAQQNKAAQDAAIERVQLDDDTLSKIYNNNAISINARIAQERALKEEKIKNDSSYLLVVEKNLTDLDSATTAANKKLIDSVKTNIFTQLKKDLDDLTNDLDKQTANQQIILDKQFEAGNLSITGYEAQRTKITVEANKAALQNTIDYLSNKAKLLKADGQDTSEVENQIAQARLQLEDDTADQILAKRQKLYDALQGLASTAEEAVTSTIDAEFQAQQDAAEAQLNALQAQQAKEITLAGDNSKQKAVINEKYAALEAKQQQKENDAKKKQAIFDKAKSIFDIAINTAVAIVKSVAALPLDGGLPFSAIAAAIGALEIAAVIAKPIPQFAKGVDSAPGGLAIINEEGQELMFNPRTGKGKIINSDGPTLANVAQGTKIFTAAQTDHLLNEPLAMQMATGMNRDANNLTVISEDRHDKRLAFIFEEGFNNLGREIRRTARPGLTDKGIEEAFRKSLEWSEYVNKKYK